MEDVFFKLKLKRLLFNYGIPITAAISLGSFLHQYIKLLNTSNVKSKTSVSGLTNFGQTCYLNALLQALSSCQSFSSYLKNAKSHSKLVLKLSDLMDVVN